MKCPKCGSYQIKVVDSRERPEDNTRWRRRKCAECGHKFHTIEDTEKRGVETMQTKVVLDEGAILPKKAHQNDAGYDLCALQDGVIFPNARALFDTGVHIAIPSGYEGHIRSRSSMMLKKGCITDGTIDSGYTGSVGVILFNLSGKLVEIKKGERIAQLVIEPIISQELVEVDCLDETERGNKGFGSTGQF